jgi:hypothetical protein
VGNANFYFSPANANALIFWASPLNASQTVSLKQQKGIKDVLLEPVLFIPHENFECREQSLDTHLRHRHGAKEQGQLFFLPTDEFVDLVCTAFLDNIPDPPNNTLRL